MPLQSPIFLALYPLFWHEIGHIIMELQRANPQWKKICVAGHLPFLWDIIFPADIPDFPLPKKIALPKSSFDAIFTYLFTGTIFQGKQYFSFCQKQTLLKKLFGRGPYVNVEDHFRK